MEFITNPERDDFNEYVAAANTGGGIVALDFTITIKLRINKKLTPTQVMVFLQVKKGNLRLFYHTTPYLGGKTQKHFLHRGELRKGLEDELVVRFLAKFPKEEDVPLTARETVDRAVPVAPPAPDAVEVLIDGFAGFAVEHEVLPEVLPVLAPAKKTKPLKGYMVDGGTTIGYFDGVGSFFRLEEDSDIRDAISVMTAVSVAPSSIGFEYNQYEEEEEEECDVAYYENPFLIRKV